MLCDYHMHSHYSDDSDYDMEQVVKDSIALGLDEICFTDHVDYGIKADHDGIDVRGIEGRWNVDYPSYAAEIASLKKKYAGQITIKMGLEFGMQTHTIADFEKLYKRYDFDFIILSCHQAEDKEFWTYEFQKGRTVKEYTEKYYEEILDVMENYKDYSVLGHLDSINRYDRGESYPFEKIKPLLTKILERAIADGKGIEVNTSSFRYGVPDLTPSRDILRLYKELGGSIITVGSDSHAPGYPGSHIAEVREELAQMGFDQICTYEKMRPRFHPMAEN